MKKKTRWWLPDVVDLHIYGGMLLLGTGLYLWSVWAGPAVVGLILLTLGLRRG